MGTDTASYVVTGPGGHLGQAFLKSLCADNDVHVLSAGTKGMQLCVGGRSQEVGGGLDLTTEEGVRTVAARCLELPGRLAVINCIGYFPGYRPMLEISYTETERILRTNLLAASFIALGLLPLLRSRGGGHIINFSTLSVRDALPLMSAFDSAKAAVEQLTRHIAHEFGGDGIQANAFALATLRTPDEISMKPQGDHTHWVDPHEVAALVRDFVQGRFGLINGAVIPCYHHSELFYRTAFVERVSRQP